MVTIKEMENAVGHRVRITFYDGSKENTLVRSYQYEPDDDEKPWIEFTPNRADYQSSIKNIEILD